MSCRMKNNKIVKKMKITIAKFGGLIYTVSVEVKP